MVVGMGAKAIRWAAVAAALAGLGCGGSAPASFGPQGHEVEAGTDAPADPPQPDAAPQPEASADATPDPADGGVPEAAEDAGEDGGADAAPDAGQCVAPVPSQYVGCYPVTSCALNGGVQFDCADGGSIPPVMGGGIGSCGNDPISANCCSGLACTWYTDAIVVCYPPAAQAQGISATPDPSLCSSGWRQLTAPPAPVTPSDTAYCCGPCCNGLATQ